MWETDCSKASLATLNFKLVAITPPKLLSGPIYSLNYIHVLNHHIFYVAVKILTEYSHVSQNMHVRHVMLKKLNLKFELSGRRVRKVFERER